MEVIRLPFNYQKITFFKIPTAIDLHGLQSISKNQLPKLPFFDGSTLNSDSLWGGTLAGDVHTHLGNTLGTKTLTNALSSPQKSTLPARLAPLR